MEEIIWQYLNPGRLTPIEEALARQTELLEQKLAGDPNNYLLFAEHDHVYSYPPRVAAKLDSLCKLGKDNLPARLFETPDQRGGSITYHGPGQLVCYFIVDITVLNISLYKFLVLAEEVVIEALEHFGIGAHKKPVGLPTEVEGVWVTKNGIPKKLVSFGVRASREMLWQNKITTNGCAVNICTDLSYFNDYIYPCGHPIQMTSMKKLTTNDYDTREVAEVIAKITSRRLKAIVQLAYAR